jgi:hypothetical protein
MLSHAPIQWTDPATWPWMFYVWAVFALVVLAKPTCIWFRRQRAGGWPSAEGRIESVEITKPSFSFTTKRGYYVAELGFSYSVAGTLHSGLYKSEFPTEHEAEDFVRDLKGKPVAVPYNAIPLPVLRCSNPISKACSKTALPPRLLTIPQRRTPFQIGSDASLWFFVFLSAIGLVVSLWIHLGAVMGRRVAPEAFFWVLGVGIFIVWLPAVLVAQRLVGSTNRKDFWRVILKGSPDWMRYMVYGFLGYAMVNFLLFMTKAPSGG